LLHLLGALDSVDSGRVLICGEDLFSLPIKKQGALRNRYLGFVYQFHHLLQEFTAIENVAIPLLIAGKEPAQAMEAAADMVAKVGLKNRGSHRPSALSGGERQRIAIARALVTRPACILADEPTGNLDRKNAESVYELMSELNSMEQTAFLIVSHDSQLARYMDRHYTLADGVLQVNEK
jgi:lipoprotein-releasing system ATP-binding protein